MKATRRGDASIESQSGENDCRRSTVRAPNEQDHQTTRAQVLAIDTFGPAAARLPQWVPPLAVAGVLLMFVGAKFERSCQAAQRASHTFKHFG